MIYIILAAYNEEEAIPALFQSIIRSMRSFHFDYTLVFINDGSLDQTKKLVEAYHSRLPIILLDNKKNLGWAKSIQRGFQYVLEQGIDDDVVVTMDADNTHSPDFINKMVSIISRGGDVVIASRYQVGSQVVGLRLHRVILSYVASLLFRLLFPIERVRDYTCGYRAYRLLVLRKAFSFYGSRFIEQRGFSFMADILLKLRRFGFQMYEVPFSLRYDYKKSMSKMKIITTVYETLLLMMKRKLIYEEI